MPSPNVDLVFVIDTSASMAPCFDRVRKHLHAVIKPLQGHVNRVNFALVAACASKNGSSTLHHVQSLAETDLGMDLIGLLYGGDQGSGQGSGRQLAAGTAAARERLFTTDADRLLSRIGQLEPAGDEDMLLALDIALDLPFGPLETTKRVVALFSDEPFESGVDGDQSNRLLPELIAKIHARHVHLFLAVPDGPAATQLASVDRAEVEIIGDKQNGLADVDFGRLFAQMGQSISCASLQETAEPAYRRALFEQDKWVPSEGEMSGR